MIAQAAGLCLFSDGCLVWLVVTPLEDMEHERDVRPWDGELEGSS